MRHFGGLYWGVSLLGLASACALAAAPAQAQAIVQPLPPRGAGDLNDALRRLASSPRDLGALLDAGEASLLVGDIDAAIGFFARAQDLAPTNGRMLSGLARAFTFQHRPIEALRLFAEAEQAGISDATMVADRGLAFDLVGDNASAQALYRQSLNQRDDAEVRRRLALSLAMTGRRNDFEATLLPQLQAEDRSGFRARAFGLAILGDADLAVEIAEALMPTDLALRMAPYLRYMPRLTRAQQAAAANLGAFPRATDIGRDDAEIASYNAAGTRIAANASTSLTPSGPAMDAVRTVTPARTPPPTPTATPRTTSTPAPALAPATTPTLTRAQRREAERAAREARRTRRDTSTDPLGRARTRTTRVAAAPATIVPTPVPAPAPVPAPTPAPVPQPAPAPAPVELARVVSQAPEPGVVPTVQSAPAQVETRFDLARVDPGNGEVQPDTAPVQIAVAHIPEPTPAPAPEPTPGPTPQLSVADAFAGLMLPDPAAVRPADAVDITTIRPPRERAEPPPIAKPAPPPPPPPVPARHWVQVATGKDRAALKFDWRRIARKADTLIDGKGPFVTPWGEANRLLAGPYPTAAAAREMVTKLKALEVDSFTFASAQGEAIEKLD